eukprot:87198-Pelagomonas_calceolata.AAC.2
MGQPLKHTCSLPPFTSDAAIASACSVGATVRAFGHLTTRSLPASLATSYMQSATPRGKGGAAELCCGLCCMRHASCCQGWHSAFKALSVASHPRVVGTLTYRPCYALPIHTTQRIHQDVYMAGSQGKPDDHYGGAGIEWSEGQQKQAFSVAAFFLQRDP